MILRCHGLMQVESPPKHNRFSKQFHLQAVVVFLYFSAWGIVLKLLVDLIAAFLAGLDNVIRCARKVSAGPPPSEK
jgi:hypothetical protein